MLWAEGGGMELSQWDTGVWLFFDEACDGVLLSLESVLGTHPADAVPFGGIYRVRVPDELLCQSGYLRVTLLVRDTDGERAAAQYRLRIRARQKPRDYIRGTDERTLLARLMQRVEALEKRGTGGGCEGDCVRFDENQIRTAKERAQACDNIGALSGDVLESEVVDIVMTPGGGEVGQTLVITGYDEDGSPIYGHTDFPEGGGSGTVTLTTDIDVRCEYGNGTNDAPIRIDFASGETYVFTPGTYYVASHMPMSTNGLRDITIRAHGATLVLCDDVFIETTIPGFRMYGGTLDGSGAARYGIRLSDSAGCVFDGVTFTNIGSASTTDTQMLALYGDCTGFVVRGCTFDGCTAGVVGDDGFIHAYGLFINRLGSNNEYSRSGTVENCEFTDIAGIDTAEKKADGDGIFVQAPPYEDGDGNIVYPDCRVVISGCRFYDCKKRGVKVAAHGVTIEGCVFEGDFWYAGVDLQYGHCTVRSCHIVNTSDYNGSVTSALVASDGGFSVIDCYLSAPYYDAENTRDTYHPGIRCTTRLPASVIGADAVWDVIYIDGCYFDGVSRGVQLYNSNTGAVTYRLRGLEITGCRFGAINQTHGVNVSTTLFSEIGVFVFTDFRFDYGNNRTAVNEAMAAAHPGLDREFKYPVGIGVPVTLSFVLCSKYWTDEPMSGYDGLPDCPHALVVYSGGNMGGIVYKRYTAHGSYLVGTRNPADVTATLGKQLLYNSKIGDQYTNRTDGTVWVCVGAGGTESVGTWQQSGVGGGGEYESGMEVYY